jgi:predicted amidophosphoribosyltransferase
VLGLVERRDNVRGAFRARGARGRLVLVDDVMTTGATAEACTAALLDSGAEEVAVLTLARALP